MVAAPVWGALSDRTTSRYGRRVPWIAGGTLGGVTGLALLAAADGVAGMITGWCLVQLALNAPFAALSAAVADQVPERQRGTVGGWFGVGSGVFTSVDLALMTRVLPAEADHGKDLGLLNIASALPQVLAPVVAAPVVGHLGGYPALYGLSALAALAGAVLVHRIRGVP